MLVATVLASAANSVYPLQVSTPVQAGYATVMPHAAICTVLAVAKILQCWGRRADHNA